MTFMFYVKPSLAILHKPSKCLSTGYDIPIVLMRPFRKHITFYHYPPVTYFPFYLYLKMLVRTGLS